MQTIEYLSPKKRKEIATETKEIFVPLAHRLGMASLKGDLEDLSLRCLDPKGYKSIDKKISESSKKSSLLLIILLSLLKKN
ncbi:MAG: hypothetical protein Ct9H90mP15_06350 [Candidatus Neomarinimicrobiota bacterium]|nr:MAG: hypothetical protein Ct9H90mP15_06350 [Candidatus Neomarinimicrobiota bacterium]